MAAGDVGKILKKWPDLIVVFVRVFHLFFGSSGSCRFEPTCSKYSAQAFRTHGVLLGFILSVKRLLKCHPFGAQGLDSVGERLR